MSAPQGYVPGLGRGAAGFTTRSDIGPARGGAPGDKDKKGAPGKRDDGGQEEMVDENKFDEFMGNDAGMFGTIGEYDEDDREADRVWEKIDDFMDERRRDKREARLQAEIEKYRAENPKITEQFADLKRKLGEVSAAEWEGIPDIGDYTIKKKKFENFTPVPDTLLDRAAKEKETVKSLDPNALGLGLVTPVGGGTSTVSDLTAIGMGRGTVLELKLDRMADSVSGQTVVDPKGYLTDLKSVTIKSDTEISDIKRIRHLLKSVYSSNKNYAPGWIAAARLEELSGRVVEARKLLAQACEVCPKSEDVWLEASRLQTGENAKAVLARGVAQIPDSIKLWMAAARLEDEDAAKARVLRKALERIPTSVRLWKAAVELASEADARILLSRAVECCPQHVDLWLALARLETYENAKKVLNKARAAIPTDMSIWITAAKLEDAQGNYEMVDKIIPRAIQNLQKEKVTISRDAWIKEAENAERADPPLLAVCRACVRAVVSLGIDEEDRERTWMADAEDALKRGSVETARAIYATALAAFPGKASVWRAAAQLEKSHGTRADLDDLLRKAVTYCPQAEVLWLMAAKEKWLGGDVAAARQILSEAFAANPDSEEIWLAAFKLEFENQEPERARLLLAKAREDEAASSHQRVWMKSAVVERELGNVQAERAILEEGIRRFPAFDKLYLMLGQLEQRLGSIDAARSVYRTGLGRCMSSVALWRAAAGLEEKAGNVAKARALLEQARLKNPKNDELWLSAIRTETRAGSEKAAEVLLAKGLQDCPASGLLWAEAIAIAPRPQRRSKSTDALKRCDKDAHVVAAVAHLFASDRKVEKARSWFNRAVTLNPDIGDHWAHFYKFELQHGTPDTQAQVMTRAIAAEPHHGERWQRVAKDPKNAHQPIATLIQRTIVDIDMLPPP